MSKDSSSYEKLKNLVQEAKSKVSKESIEIIAKDLNLKNIQQGKSKDNCPFHEDDVPSLNAFDDGTFHCFGCGKHYDIIDHFMEYDGLSFPESAKKLLELADINYDFATIGQQSNKDYAYPYYDKSDSRDKVEQYLSIRKISKKTLDYCDIQQGKNNDAIVFNYYDDNNVLTSVKYRPAKKLSKNDTKCWFQQGSDNRLILYNMNRIDPTKPLIIAEGECFPGNAEVLTPEGWVELQEYDNQLVMQVDNDMSGKFVVPMAYIKKDYSGDLTSVSVGENYFIETTPNHNIVYNYHNLYKDTWELRKKPMQNMAETISGHIPTTIKYDGTGINLTNNQIALFIAISADGTLDERRTSDDLYIRIQFKKKRKIKRFKNLLDTNKIEYTESIPKSRPSFVYFGFTAPEWITTKLFPMEWLGQMSLEQKKFFISEIVHWGGNNVINRNQIEYSSKEIHNATFVQAVSHTTGYMSTIIHRHNKRGEWYKVSILFDKNHVGWQLVDKRNNRKQRKYEGSVYCVQVPSGMMVIRQDKKISVIGNCDLLSLIECGFKNSVSVPNGANTKWIEENFEWLEQFEKIIIWSDNDKAGIKMRREACSRLGTWRTHFVSMPEDFRYENEDTGKSWIIKDINEVLFWYGKDKVVEFIENAQETPIEGVDNLARVDDFDLETIEGLTPKLASLQETVYKFLFGSVLLVTGVRGAGKSTLINQLFVCDPLNDGYNVFLFSGELGSPILRSWLERTLAGPEYVELIDDFVHKIPKEVEKKMREWYDGRVWIYCESNNNAEDIINKAIATTRKYGVKIWVFDNLMTLDIGADDYNLNQKQKDFIVKLNKKAMEYNVLAVLVTHPRKLMRGQDLTTDDISGSGDLGNMAQYIMSVRRFSDKEKEGELSGNGGYKKGREPIVEDSEIRLMKNRYTGKIGAARLFFDYRSYRFYKNWKTELYRKYVWDKSTTYNYREVHKERHNGPFGGN